MRKSLYILTYPAQNQILWSQDLIPSLYGQIYGQLIKYSYLKLSQVNIDMSAAHRPLNQVNNFVIRDRSRQLR